MTAFVERHFLPALMALLLLLVTITSGEQIRKWWTQSTTAIQWQGVEVITKTVQPGGILTVEYTAIVNKQCPSDLRGFIVASDGSSPIRFPVVAGGYTKPSPDPITIRVAVTIPPVSNGGLAPLRSGPHIYRTMATRFCPDGVEEDNSIPDAPFILEVP